MLEVEDVDVVVVVVVIVVVVVVAVDVIAMVQFGNSVYPDLQIVHLLPIILALQIHPSIEIHEPGIDP